MKDMSAAYEGLSDRMQQFISGLEGIHDMKPFRPLFGKSEEERKKLQHFELMFPPQLHPVVSIHPVSKKKVLFINPQFTVGINGMNENESRALLDLLFRQALVPEYQFRHHWEPHTIAMWDNRSTQHYAIHVEAAVHLPAVNRWHLCRLVQPDRSGSSRHFRDYRDRDLNAAIELPAVGRRDDRIESYHGDAILHFARRDYV